jgi:hypothetical protein
MEDDDYYDVESDEERLHNANLDHPDYPWQNDLDLVMAMQAGQDSFTLRSYHPFLHTPSVLANYHPTFTASPLMDPTTARIFCHFITATAPQLSIYERVPVNSSFIYSDAAVPLAKQHLWTYKIPMLSLTNQGLLHAILALASLHISRLQRTPPTASLKHYHYSLRRIAKAVATPSRRNGIAIIAATLLLGHYEAMTAEHSKWSSHLAGARQLLMEVDFKGITGQIQQAKARGRAEIRKAGYNPYHGFGQGQQPPSGWDGLHMPDVDESLISHLMGWRVSYRQLGQILDDDPANVGRKGRLTEKDIESYKTHCDLFWWFCKHDVLQSIISGNNLL